MREFSVGPETFPNANYRFDGGGLAVIGPRAYLMLPTEPDLRSVDLTTGDVRVIKVDKSGYRPLERDLSARSSLSDIQAMGRSLTSFSRTVSMHAISSEFLAVQFVDLGSGGYELVVIDINGEIRGAVEELPLPRVLYAHGSSFQVIQPNADSRGSMRNPVIVKRGMGSGRRAQKR